MIHMLPKSVNLRFSHFDVRYAQARGMTTYAIRRVCILDGEHMRRTGCLKEIE